MMRKSRFGSKAGRDASRDAEQDLKEDPDGSKSISDDDESLDAEEGVDRYERSSDRYRAAAGERAGAEGSAPARRSFGNSFAVAVRAGKAKAVVGLKAVGFPAARVLAAEVAVPVASPGKAALGDPVVQACRLAAARLRQLPRVWKLPVKPRGRPASRCSSGRVIVRIRNVDRLAAGRRRGRLRIVHRQMPRLSTSDRVIAANLDVAG
jgi:hypothetical protein